MLPYLRNNIHTVNFRFVSFWYHNIWQDYSQFLRWCRLMTTLLCLLTHIPEKSWIPVAYLSTCIKWHVCLIQIYWIFLCSPKTPNVSMVIKWFVSVWSEVIVLIGNAFDIVGYFDYDSVFKFKPSFNILFNLYYSYSIYIVTNCCVGILAEVNVKPQYSYACVLHSWLDLVLIL